MHALVYHVTLYVSTYTCTVLYIVLKSHFNVNVDVCTIHEGLREIYLCSSHGLNHAVCSDLLVNIMPPGLIGNVAGSITMHACLNALASTYHSEDGSNGSCVYSP